MSSGPRRPRRGSPVECPPLWEPSFPLRPQPPLPAYDRLRRGHRRRCRCRNNSNNNSAEAATVPTTVSWCTATPAPPRTDCLLILPPPPPPPLLLLLLLLLLSCGGRGGGFPPAVLKTPCRACERYARPSEPIYPGRTSRATETVRAVGDHVVNLQRKYRLGTPRALTIGRDTAGEHARVIFVLFCFFSEYNIPIYYFTSLKDIVDVRARARICVCARVRECAARAIYVCA